MMSRRRRTAFRAALFVGACAAILAAAEAGLRAAGAAAEWRESRPSVSGGRAIRILCLGESTTAATFPFDFSWPAQLQTALDARRDGRTYEVVNRGRGGTSTGAIADRLPWILETERPQLVITMMGINDGPGRGSPRVVSGGWRELRLVRAWRWARREWGRRAWLARLENRSRAESPLDADRREQGCLLAGESHLGIGGLAACGDLLRRSAAPSGAEDPLIARGEAFWGAGDRVRAGEAFEAAVRGAGSDAARVRGELAEFFLLTGDRTDFERQWRAAWAQRPWNEDLVDLRFSQLEARGDAEQAVEFARRAAARPESRAKGHFLLLLSAFSNRRVDEAALAHGEEACRAEPGNIRYSGLLAAAYASLGRWDEADARLERLRGAHGHVPVFLALHAAAIDFSRGRRKEAAELYRRVIAEEDRRAPAVEAVAEVMLRAGRRDEAARLYDLLADEEGAVIGFEDAAPRSAEDETRAQYARIGGMLRERRIPWIAMQYPLRSVEGLKARTAGFPETALVENRANFLDAERRDPTPPPLFSDRFAGDFGHCTRAGNLLLAEAAARAVRESLGLR
jgi:tetratricopeptide (TPR) repeat protein